MAEVMVAIHKMCSATTVVKVAISKRTASNFKESSKVATVVVATMVAVVATTEVVVVTMVVVVVFMVVI